MPTRSPAGSCSALREFIEQDLVGAPAIGWHDQRRADLLVDGG